MQQALQFGDMDVHLPADSHRLYGFVRSNTLFAIIVRKKDGNISEEEYPKIRSNFTTELHQYSRAGQGWKFESSRPLRYTMPVQDSEPLVFEEATAAVIAERSPLKAAATLYLSFVNQSYDEEESRGTVRNDSVVCWLDLSSLPAVDTNNTVDGSALSRLGYFPVTTVVSLRFAKLEDHSVLVIHQMRRISIVSVRVQLCYSKSRNLVILCELPLFRSLQRGYRQTRTWVVIWCSILTATTLMFGRLKRYFLRPLFGTIITSSD